ncbi:HK97 family phage portal protein [Yoonia maritima]|uniref:HK97 family phage portal protein n=1 Tax=Yoonia maritima TaxID=1435347 RepID=A0A2T0W1K9_9RHOB|nr:phage portal protein [Yoonia maritima]PRY78892.1 HK97 family phage portal protein [Yoonia maritima]
MAFDKIKNALGLKTTQKALTLTDPSAFELFGASPTSSGFSVSANSAMRVPAVSCAVALISESVGTLPVKLFTEAKEATKDHPAYRLIHDEANEWTSASELRTALTADALLNDRGGFAQVVRLGDGTPFEMHRLDPATVTPKLEADGTPYYVVKLTAGDARFEYQDILHIQPFAGVSPITLGREAIGLSLAFEQHIATLFANGGRPSGIIKSDKALDVDAKKKIAASWFSTHSGKSAGGTAILDEGMSYDQLSLTLADAQFAENRLEQIREIARAFRVPPTMLFELSRGTWSNTEELARQFYQTTLRPWLASWTWAYAKVLLTPEERTSLYIEFVIDDLLTTNAAAKATAFAQYRAMGALTGNEVRAALNKAPLPDGNSLSNPNITTMTPTTQSKDETE